MSKSKFQKVRQKLIERGDIDPSCREVGPYYYSENKPRGKRERSPGIVARMLLSNLRYLQDKITCPVALEILEKQNYKIFPTTSFCGDYPRTKKSIEIENEGTKNFWKLHKVWEELMKEEMI